MDLEVVPSHLPIISAQLHTGHAQVAATAAPASVAAEPIPAASDSISIWASQIVIDYMRSFFQGTSDGLTGHSRLADLLPVVATNYEQTDRAGGAAVGQSATAFG
ncbi:PE domain-containing protein [Nocardia brasiliensis]|uniref:PE domain-containing protein n=1 Tax=Nocardia brasiliensis TaxID=37326 RepID=UPI003D8EFB4B